MNQDLNKAILKCQSIISLPEVYQQISIKIDQPNTTNHELAEIVKLDPGVSSKLLSIVNSAFYGFSGQISTISHAISIVGLNDFKNLVLSSSVVSLFDQLKGSDFSLHDFWSHSLMTGILTKQIGQLWVPRKDQETLFIAGLLHDVGKLLMLQTQASALHDLMNAWGNHDLCAERAVVGFDHAQAGAELIRAWELPELLALSAECHHELIPDNSMKLIPLTVFLANALVDEDRTRIQDALILCEKFLDDPLSEDQLEEIKTSAVAEKNSLIGLFLSH